MFMLYPSIDKLLNIVDSKYMLVHVVSRRAKSMLEHNHYQMNERDYVNKKTNCIRMKKINYPIFSIYIIKF